MINIREKLLEKSSKTTNLGIFLYKTSTSMDLVFFSFNFVAAFKKFKNNKLSIAHKINNCRVCTAAT